MAQTRTCDSCGYLNDDRSFYVPGWGALTGTDSLGQHVTKDLCPRCSAMLQVMLGELRRRFTAPSSRVVASSEPEPGTSGVSGTSSVSSSSSSPGRAGETPKPVPDIDGLPRTPRLPSGRRGQ